ncbi:MAG: isocyanide synthase family protein [Myxococcota bacterium]
MDTTAVAVSRPNPTNFNPSYFSRRSDRRPDETIGLAKAILADVMRYRRMAGAGSKCAADCPRCMAPHLAKVVQAIRERKPVTFVLPAFPGKSPNRAKVFGPSTDMAERRALLFLGSLCDRVQQRYAPGAHIILCSDGRVFSDVVGMKEVDVTLYQQEIKRLIDELGLSSLSTFDLDTSVLEDTPHSPAGFDSMREQLMARFGTSLEGLRASVKRGGQPDADAECIEKHRMYCGITRFLVEDSTFPGQTASRSAIQKDCRKRAYEVIRRSNAWSALVAEQFPEAVRLSIHPQSCGSEKLGIQLMGEETWMTPWHGVAVNIGTSFILAKREQVEALGARLVRSQDGRPSHFEMSADTAKLLRGAR